MRVNVSARRRRPAIRRGAGSRTTAVARDRDVLLRLLSVTASLAGLCIAALGFIEYGDAGRAYRTYADEVIAFDALLFVCCVYLILWALRTSSHGARASFLGRVVDCGVPDSR